MDEWNLISSKIKNLDVVPHRVASGASEPIRLTKADWKVLSHADGEKTLRQLSEVLGTDPTRPVVPSSLFSPAAW